VYDLVDQVRSEVAASVGADSADLVIIENASEGMNAILRSLVAPNSSVLFLDLAYFMVAETLRFLRDTSGTELVEVATTGLFPVTDSDGAEDAFDDGLVALVEAALEAHPGVGLCTFSHITSMPSVVLPVARLSAACRARGATAVVDGAHVLGNIPLDVPSIGNGRFLSAPEMTVQTGVADCSSCWWFDGEDGGVGYGVYSTTKLACVYMCMLQCDCCWACCFCCRCRRIRVERAQVVLCSEGRRLLVGIQAASGRLGPVCPARRGRVPLRECLLDQLVI